MRRHLGAAIAGLLLATPAMAVNGNIVMYFDAQATQCQRVVPCGGTTRIFVYAHLVGASFAGITGAEYKVQVGPNNNPDPGWFFQETFDPAATTVGSGAFTPIDNGLRGINVAWPSCQHGDGVKVLIETVDVLNGNCDTAELQLKVVKHDNSSNQFFQCPLFVLCDDPTFTKVCVGYGVVNNCRNPEPPFPNNAQCSTSGVAYVNPIPGRNCALIGVSPTSWSAMKGLYRN